MHNGATEAVVNGTTSATNAVAPESKESSPESSSKGGILVKGVLTGVAASTITQTGRGIMSIVIRNPVAMFAVGFAAGYFAHKYRKEIIAKANLAAEKSKSFVLHQKESILDLVAEAEESKEATAAARAK